MRTTVAGVLQRGPLRSHRGDPAVLIRRGDLAAALTAITLIAGLLLVPAAVPMTVALLAAGCACRWPARWLLVPLLASVVWLAAAGPGSAFSELAAGAGRLAASLAHGAGGPSRLLGYPGQAAAVAAHGLARELPLVVAVGAAQAGLVTWLGRSRARARPRGGPLAAARRRRARVLLSAGETVTGSGCAVGLDARTGRLVTVSWAEAGRGALLTGADPADLVLPALAVACAALRRRKTILALGPGDGQVRCAALAQALGVPVTWACEPDGEFGRAIRARSVVLAAGPALALLDEAIGVLGWLEQRRLRGDCLLWLSGCEATDPGRLAALLALGSPTGTAVLLSTASPACAEALVPQARLTVACGPVSPQLAARLAGTGQAADDLAGQRPGMFTIIGPDGMRPGCLAVPVTALAPAGTGPPASGAPVAAGRR